MSPVLQSCTYVSAVELNPAFQTLAHDVLAHLSGRTPAADDTQTAVDALVSNPALGATQEDLAGLAGLQLELDADTVRVHLAASLGTQGAGRGDEVREARDLRIVAGWH